MAFKDLFSRVKDVGSKVSKPVGKEDDINVEEYLSTLGQEEAVQEETAERYVKSIPVNAESDIQKLEEELLGGSILLINVETLQKKSPEKAKEALKKLKDFVAMNGGDIARITAERLIVTPKGIKIQKKG